VPATEYAVETAVQMVWKKFVGPLAVIPIGTLVTKLTNVEGMVMGVLGQETFSEGRQAVPEEVYSQELDAEPTLRDYQELARDGAAYALLKGRSLGGTAVAVALDGDRRSAAIGTAIETGEKAKKGAQEFGARVAAAVPAVATEAVSMAKDAAVKAPGQLGKDVAVKGPGMLKGAFSKAKDLVTRGRGRVQKLRPA